MRRWWRPALAGVMLGGAATAQGPAVLSAIAPGEWVLHEAGPGGSVRRLCITRPAQLFQIRHGGGECARVVLEETPKSATVSYSCPTGTGRTTLTATGDGQLRIRTQGLVAGAPFDVDYDAKLIGRCA